MQCKDTQQLLEQHSGQVRELPSVGRAHVKDCESCTAYAEDLQFARLLQGLPVTPASVGFADRALQQAWLQGEGSDTRDGSGIMHKIAVAACLVLATSVALQTQMPVRDSESDDSPTQVVQLAPRAVSEVNLLMVSPADYPETTITLRMDANVRLAGYEANDELRWPVSLTAGNNQLTLPVQLQGNDSGNIFVQVESNGASKEMQFTVDAVEPQRAALMVI